MILTAGNYAQLLPATTTFSLGDQAKVTCMCLRPILSPKAIIWRQGSTKYRHVLTAGVGPEDGGFNSSIGTAVCGVKPGLSRLSRS